MDSALEHQADLSEGGPRFSEPHPFPAAPRGGDLSLSANGVDRDLRDRTVRSRRAEENVARAALACRGVERYLARGHSKCLHDGIGLDEAAAEERAEAEQRAA